MNLYEIQEKLKTMRIQDIPLNVALYSRVSTDSLMQATSIVNQSEGGRAKILENKKWNFVGEFVDEGISGTSTSKRTEFNHMIELAKEGKIDLIVTKSVARFGRNTIDVVQTARELKKSGVGIWFFEDGILSLDNDGEMRLTMMAAFAQSESERKSVNVRFGQQMAIKRGTVFGFDNMFGYHLVKGKLIVDEKEAPMVRTLFEMYATDKYSMNQIEEYLYELGYRNHKGNKISHATMANIIRNPKYKGIFCGGKVTKLDLFSEKIEFLTEDKWTKIDGGVPALVSEELWERANEVLARRSKDVKNKQNQCTHPNLMTGKLFCVHCGRPYHRKSSHGRVKNNNSTWVCAGKIQNGAATCPGKYLHESEIKELMYEMFCEMKPELEPLMQEYVRIVQKALEGDDTLKRIENLKDEVKHINEKKSKLLSLNISGKIDDDDFEIMNNQLASERKEREKEILRLEDVLLKREKLEEKFEEIKGLLTRIGSIENPDMIDDVFIRNYIERVDVETIDGVTKLNIKLITGKQVEKYLGGLLPVHKGLRLLTGRNYVFKRLTPYGSGWSDVVYCAEIQVI